MSKIDIFCFFSAISVSGLLAGCVTPDPPPFPLRSAADPQVRSSSRPPRFVGRDQTTEEVERALAAIQEEGNSAQNMQHGMGEMPGMAGMDHGEMQHAGGASSEKKQLAEEMQKTSGEMKATSEQMKKAEGSKTKATIYSCPMHPHIQSDKPGKCPICGMTLVKKKETQ